MKKLKQILSVLAALVLVVGMTFSNIIAAGNGTITITNAVEGQDYKAYKLLDLSYSAPATENDEGKYAYTIAEGWKDFFNEGGAGHDYVTINNGYVTWKEDKKSEDDMKAFSKVALTYASTNGITVTATAVPDTITTEDGEKNIAVFSGLDLGYYLVTTTTGTVLSLTSTDTAAKVEDKNTPPTVDKTVEEDSTKKFGDKNDADLGQVVNFKTEIVAKPGAKNYVLHDTMTHMTLLPIRHENNNAGNLGNITVMVGETAVSPSDYDISYNPSYLTENSTDDNCTFEISFKQSFLDSIENETVITVRYSATVDADAVIGGEGNPNETHLEYGEKNNLKTDPDTTKTFVWDIDIFKHDKENNALKGAEFQIADKDGNVLTFVEVSDGNYRKATTEDNVTDTLVSDANGKIHVDGLDEGTYTVTETKAPDGYNKLSRSFTITITSETDAADATKLVHSVDGSGLTEIKTEEGLVKVLNTTGSKLPETGGMGTTYLYLAGGLLVLGSAVQMIVRKRMSAE